jgi:hypothetical protein
VTVSVEKERFLRVACGNGEQIVFDRNRDEFHLLRGVAAEIWERVAGGGTFHISDIGAPEIVGTEDFGAALREMEKAQLVHVEEDADGSPDAKINRRAWIGITGKAAAAATVLPFVMTLVAPRPRLAMAHGGGGDSNGGDSNGQQR